MAMTTKRNLTSFKLSSQPPYAAGHRKEKPFCTHCKIQGHMIENCFKIGNVEPPRCGHTAERCYRLHSCPPGYKLHGKAKIPSIHANQSVAYPTKEEKVENNESVALTRSQYQQLNLL
ncbi:hypothetical protein Nepgr_022716 [Nepenthes gracilis]|uniref:Uncharacterized protein n=1 Tax=Nepenthes gracilis TaxID=150966 RepID=A0AAD3T198_NEPGR|nr:hypothetical protein Nepgr_022716 [Nepenthes gracilis]